MQFTTRKSFAARFPAPVVCECTYCGTRTDCRIDSAGNPACDVCRPNPAADIPVGPGTDFPTISACGLFAATADHVRATRGPVVLVPVNPTDTEADAARRCGLFCTGKTSVRQFLSWYNRHAAGCVVTAWSPETDISLFEVATIGGAA